METELIDYDRLESNALLFRPKIIIAGASSYPRLIDYKRMAQICQKVGALLMADIAHISGLIAAKVIPGPFEHAHVVTTTTHKTLQSVRSGLIFYRKGIKNYDSNKNPIMYDFGKNIDSAVFPGLQGGPHNHQIAAVATSLLMAKTANFKAYQQQVIKNCQAMVNKLKSLSYKMVTGGSDNHLCLIDLRPKYIDGSKIELILEKAMITVNKNSVPGDKSAIHPGGLRLGTPAMTSRGLVEEHFEKIALMIDKAVQIGLHAQEFTGSKDWKKFIETCSSNDIIKNYINSLRIEVNQMVENLPINGHDDF